MNEMGTPETPLRRVECGAWRGYGAESAAPVAQKDVSTRTFRNATRSFRKTSGWTRKYRLIGQRARRTRFKNRKNESGRHSHFLL